MLKASLLAGLLRPGVVEPMREAMALLPEDADPVLRGPGAGGAGPPADAVRRGRGRGRRRPGRRVAAIDRRSAPPSAESHARNTLATGLAAIGEEAEAQVEWERAGALARGSTKTELRFFINYSDALNLTGRYADAVEPGAGRDRAGPGARPGALDRLHAGRQRGGAADRARPVEPGLRR